LARNEGSRDAAKRILDMAQGFEVTQLVYVAAKLGIADHLKTEPRSSDKLAGLVGAHPSTLYRVMRALSSLGVFHEREVDSSRAHLSQNLYARLPQFSPYVGNHVWRGVNVATVG